MCERVVVAAAVVALADLFDESCVQQTDIILNAININTMRIVAIIPMKYGVDSCELTTIKLSAGKRGIKYA